MPFRPGWALCMALPDWRLGGHTISDRPPPEEPSRGGKVPRSLEVGPWRRDGASRKALDLRKCMSHWWTVVFIEDTRDDGLRTILRTWILGATLPMRAGGALLPCSPVLRPCRNPLLTEPCLSPTRACGS